MFKLIRRTRRILLVMVLLTLGIPIAFFLWAGKGIQKGIETVTSKILDVPVTLEKVDLSLWRSRLALQGLTIGNPPGYQTARLLQLQHADVSLDIRTVHKEPVHIREIHIDGINVIMEQQGLNSNLRDILERIPKPYEPNYPKGPQLLIDVLEITNITVQTKLSSLPGEADVVTTKLPPIHMVNLGKDEEMDFAILTGRILMAFVNAILKHGIEGVSGDILRNADQAIHKITEFGRRLFDPNGLGLKF